jgi:uncharacterized glyoxalase superfamily protein PhnB
LCERRSAVQDVVMNQQNPPASTVWGTFQAQDALAMIEFLAGLGFEKTAVYAGDDDPAVVHHAQLDWPEGGGVMFGSHKPPGPGVWSRPTGGASFYVVTADPRAVHARAQALGADILRAPSETDYGSVEFALADPEGNHWSFGTYPGEPRAEGG